MKLVLLSVLFSFSVMAAEKPVQTEFTQFCERIMLEKGAKLEVTGMERRLICGDPKNDTIGKPWSDIPAKQAQVFLQSFLQSRGYHNPKFDIRGEKLYVTPGQITKLTSFEIIRPPAHWRQPRRRMIKGEPFTPKLLNDLESWTLREIQNVGYACADVQGFGDPDTGLARVEINENERKRILDVLDLRDTELAPGVADRFNAFRIGDFYSEKLVQLSRRRLLQDGLMQAASFTHECYPNGVIIKRDPVLGPPREFRAGVGGNTDDGLRVRLRGKQIRIGSSASNAEALIDASLRRQLVRTVGRYFYSVSSPRDSIEPAIQFERRDEEKFESRSWKISTYHVWNRELSLGNAELRLGPAWNILEQRRGIGAGETTLITLESLLRWQSHDNEYFEQSPRDGSRLEAQLLRTQADWGAPFTATRVAMQGQTLWNFMRYDPPLFVLGLRYSLGTTRTEEGVSAASLPVQFRFFAGGTEDLRGFNRQTLPRSGAGALTEALAGLEIRAYRMIFKQLDPFIFTDAGKLGSKTAQLDDPIYWSPGAGMRWESPVGVFRVFGAYGIISSRPAGYLGDEGRWRLGLSYGEEF
jgi:translocation and assembly module TamA